MPDQEADRDDQDHHAQQRGMTRGTLERGDYESVAHRWLSSEPGEGVERSWGHARAAAG
jgi:hypothetical protein